MADKNEVKITFKAFNKDFNKGMSEMNKETKDLKQEMKLQAEQMKHTSTQTEKLDSSISGLQKEYDIAERKTKATSDALKKAKSLWGETSNEVAIMEAVLKSNQIAQQQTANKITETTKALDKLKDNDAKEALNELVNESKKLEAEQSRLTSSFKLQNAELGDNASEAETAALAQKRLSSQIGLTENAVKNLEQQLVQTKKVYGDNSREAMQMETKLNGAKSSVTNLKSELSKLKSADTNIKINVDADLTGINKMKNAIDKLPEEAKQAGKEIGNNLATGAAAGLAGIAALTAGTDDTNKQLSRLESQASAATKSVNKLGANTKEMSDKDLATFADSLSIKEDELSKSLDAQLSSVEGNFDRQERALDKSLDSEMSALEDSQRKKLKMIDEEYKERLKLIDEEEYKRLKSIDNQINTINAQQEAADKASKKAQENEKRRDLELKVNIARDAKSKQEAKKNLALFESQLAEERLQEQRKAKIDNLKEQKDAVKDEFDKKRDAVKDEQQLKIEQLGEQFNAEKEALANLNELKKEQFNVQKEAYLATVKEQYAAELEEFKKMNAQKIADAEKPVVVPIQPKLESANLTKEDFTSSRVIFDAVKQDTDQAIEALGNLTGAGYDTEEKLIAISKSIAGAIQLSGDTFSSEGLADSINTTTNLGEVTGQLTDLLEKNGMTAEEFNAQLQQYATVGERANYISELLASKGLTDVYDNMAKTNPEIIAASEAQVRLTDASVELADSFRPLLTEIKNLAAGILEFMAEHPAFTSAIVTIAALIGGIGAIIAIVAPVMAGLGAIAAALGVSMGAVAAPIGIAILVIGLLVGAIVAVVKNWGSITDWLGEKWTAFWEWFKGLLNGIGDFFKEWGPKILSFITNPIGTMYKFFKDTWNNLDNETKAKFASIFEKIMTPINKARDGVKAAIDKIKSFFNFDFKWPKLKTPKFSIKGSINPLDWFGEGIPKINIAWNALGGVFTKPTVLNTSTGLQGFGEAGNEAILPLNERVLGAIGRAIFASTGDTGTGSPTIYNYEKMLDGAVFHVREEADIKRVARELYNLQQVDKRGQ